jgi:uncharacterized membrane protein
MMAEVIVLRLVHILGGIIWVGGMTVMAFFVMPVLTGLGPAAGPVMAGLNQKKFPVIMPIIALLTILSGLRLLMIDSASFEGSYFQSPVGRMFAMAGGLAILAFLFGIIVVRPVMMKSMALGQQMASADATQKAKLEQEMGSLRKRGATANMIIFVMLLLAALGMATARYMG